MTNLKIARKCLLLIVSIATVMMTLAAPSSAVIPTGLNGGAPTMPNTTGEKITYDYSCDCRVPICRYATQSNCYVNASACYIKKCQH